MQLTPINWKGEEQMYVARKRRIQKDKTQHVACPRLLLASLQRWPRWKSLLVFFQKEKKETHVLFTPKRSFYPPSAPCVFALTRLSMFHSQSLQNLLLLTAAYPCRVRMYQRWYPLGPQTLKSFSFFELDALYLLNTLVNSIYCLSRHI